MIEAGPAWSFCLAVAPIAVVLIALVAKTPALWAGLAGLTTAGAGMVISFPVSWPVVSSTASAMSGTFITVAFILLGGVGLAEITRRSGAQSVIAEWLSRLGHDHDKLVVIILIAYGITPFMESVTGFGLGVVITAPLLIHLGLSPARAVTTGLLGLVLVPWGSLAPGTLVAADLSGVGFTELGVWSALLTLPVLVINMAVIILINQRRITLRQLGGVSVLLLAEWALLIAANVFIGPPLAGVLAASGVILMIAVHIRWRRGYFPAPPAGIGRAVIPYAILTAGLLGSTAGVAVGALRPSMANPALWLMIAVSITVFIERNGPAPVSDFLVDTLRRWQPVAAITLLFMLLGTVMSANGMAQTLATTAASMGSVFLVFVPIIGALGGYLTGSNTGAAAMFSTATASAAPQVSASGLISLAAQNVAGSAAIIASPPRVALAASVAFGSGEKLPATAHRTLLTAVGATVIVLAAVLPALAG